MKRMPKDNRRVHVKDAKPYIRYHMGFVVGIVYYDGGEWLTRNQQLCRQSGTGPDSEPTYYQTPEQARKAAEKLTETNEHPVFFRGYTYETPDVLTKYKRTDDPSLNDYYREGKYPVQITVNQPKITKMAEKEEQEPDPE